VGMEMITYTYADESLQKNVEVLNRWMQAYTTEIYSKKIYVDLVLLQYLSGKYQLTIYYVIGDGEQ
jgi:hypothetical protein